jgi:ribose transport system permease protein
LTGTSIRSTALEPAVGTPLSRRLFTVYGLVFLLLVLLGLFSFLQPNTFPTWLNFRLTAGGKAVQILVALAVTVPMVAGKIDLSVGYAIGLWQVLSLTLQTRYGLPWWLACLVVFVGGAVVGLVNALLVELAQVDAFIATLATGQVLFGITLWHTKGQQVVDRASKRGATFDKLGTWSLGGPNGVPGPLIMTLLIGALLYFVLEYLPVGRYFYAVGANPRSAELAGIPRRKYVIAAFVASGVIIALGGIILESRLGGVAQANIGPEYLFPALVAAFLGSTTIRPGRVNALGTLVGIAIATVGLSGLLQQFPGRDYFLGPLFNGLTLIAAITIASTAGRRRISASERHTTNPTTGPPAAPITSQTTESNESIPPTMQYRLEERREQ